MISMDFYRELGMVGRLEGTGNLSTDLPDSYRADQQLEQIRKPNGQLASIGWVEHFLSILDEHDIHIEALLKKHGITEYQKQPAMEALTTRFRNHNERVNQKAVITATEAQQKAEELIQHYRTQTSRKGPKGCFPINLSGRKSK
jgi:hypothetical protein